MKAYESQKGHIMKYYLFAIGILTLLVFFGGPALAEPWSSSCADAIAHVRRAQETVKAKQVEVTKAERGERIRFERAEICKPGGIIVAGRVTECVRLSRQVPIVIQELADAKADRQPALDRFEEALNDLNQRCQQGPRS